ncbi:MAG TPA: YqaJ viral recombinase family protein [Bryobacteraceae bacterium]|nr:YqaJ viral recombinase family protein [Bryobacteraceae bacterium]
MIIHQCQQGSEDWYRLRLGIPTASEFFRLVTPTGKLSSQADTYMNHLLAEWITGAPLESVETSWMQHGHEYEAQAAASFAFETDLETETVGFITTDDGMIGASPDRIVVGGRLGVELKCPSPQVHVGYMRHGAIDDKYRPQVQGQMLVAGFEAVYLQSYCPGLPTVVIRTDRDEKYLETLSGALCEFVERLLTARADLEKRYGPFKRICEPPKPDPMAGEFLSAADAEEIVRRAFPNATV